MDSRKYLLLFALQLLVHTRYIYLYVEPRNAWFLKQHPQKAACIVLEDIKKQVNMTSVPKITRSSWF